MTSSDAETDSKPITIIIIITYKEMNERVAAWSAGESISTVEYLEPASGRWQLAEPMRTLRSRVGIAVLKGTEPVSFDVTVLEP